MRRIAPKNLTAQLAHRGRGNPPGVHPSTSIANCFPGLEFDFRNLWKQAFVGLELHESLNYVTDVSLGSLAGAGVVRGSEVRRVTATAPGADPIVMDAVVPTSGPGVPADSSTHLEWTNLLSEVVRRFAGERVTLALATPSGAEVVVDVEVRTLLDGATIAEDAAAPGQLTHGLCSPWQADYRECGCYYWAASRPDFVNVEASATQARGHNWLEREKTEQNRQYRPDGTPGLLSYEDLYRAWEQRLGFVVGGHEQE